MYNKDLYRLTKIPVWKGGGFMRTEDPDSCRRCEKSVGGDVPPRLCTIKLNKEDTFYDRNRREGHLKG